MPTYEYLCDTCGIFDVQRPSGQRDAGCSCPMCSRQARRVIASAPALATMSGNSRTAHATNERAAHSPMSSGEYRAYRHPPGCGCCGSGSKATVRAADGSKGFPTKRPWMISH
ncbi:MAG: FmdB family zinc ribbon protein [Bordetella sp.]|uniref:FmdB family zinc ribbon protein n=1 Tax=Bordetella sp. TaxID=28081 RepID=UPI003F7B6F72